jgi:hypothetical protein
MLELPVFLRQKPKRGTSPDNALPENAGRRALLSSVALPFFSIFLGKRAPRSKSYAGQTPLASSKNPLETPSPEHSAEQLVTAYLERIADARQQALDATAHTPFFERFGTSIEAQQDDLKLYFPLYRAAEETFAVPWEYLWVMHEHETTASRHPNPSSSGYVGAMQRSEEFYPQATVLQAASGWEFLANAPQRYMPPGHPTWDYQEILFAGWKVRKDSKALRSQNPEMTDLEALMQAQFRYCAPQNAKLRNTDFAIVREEVIRWKISEKTG